MPGFKPTPKQNEAHTMLNKNSVVLYGGAIRGAKTCWGCMEVIYFCAKYPNSRWLMLRKSLPVLKATLLKTFRENFLDKGLLRHVRSFSETTLVLKWDNRSEIIFMPESYDGDKQLNRFKGLEINGAFIDEVNEIQEVTYDKIVERAGSWFHAPGCPAKIMLTCNPTQNWVKERFYDKWKAGTLPPKHAYLQARIYDNPHLPAGYLESLQLLPRYQYEVFVNGNWELNLKTGGEFYKCFELDQHVKDVAYNPSLPLHISWDDNVKPYLPCGIFQIVPNSGAPISGAGAISGLPLRGTEGGRALIMLDEIAGTTPRNTIAAVCNEFIRRYPNHNAGLFIYGDATANKEDTKLEKGYNFFRLIMDNLRSYKPQNRVLSANPSVVMRGNWINTVFEKQIGGLQIIIGSNCKKTINDLVLLKEAADGTKLKEMETSSTLGSYQKAGHFTDLLDYVLCSAFAKEFNEYQKGGVLSSPAFGRNAKSKNVY